MKLFSFLPWLVIRQFFMLSTFFAAGDAGLAALGGGESSVAVMDGGEESGESGGDESAAGGSSQESGEGEGEGESQQAAEGAEGKKGPQLAKPLSRDAATAVKGLKETNPKAFKEINQRLWSLDAQDKKIAEHFPEGLESAISLKGDVDTFLNDAGANDLGEVRQELNDYRVTDGKIKSGDISFVKDLPQDIQSGIYQMVPQFVDEWATRDNEGYQKYFSGLVVNTLRDTEFTTNQRDAVRLLERMGLDNPDVKEVYDLVKGNFDWIGKLKEKADKPVQSKANAGQEDTKLNTREQKIKEGELSLARNRVGTQFRSFADPKMNTILKDIYGGNVPGHVNKAEVFLRALSGLATTLGPSFSQKIDSYLSAGDEAGAIRYAKQQATDMRLTDALTKAATYLYGKPSGKKAATPQNGQNGNGKPQNAGAGNGNPNPGNDTVRTINYNPSTSSIDFKKTDEWARKLGVTRAKLLLQNKAVLKNGHRVTWKHDAPEEGR